MLFCIIILKFNANGQVTIQNIGFETGTFVGWNGFTGSCCPINTPVTGITGGRHTITTGSGADIYSNGLIPVTAPGSVYSVKLGNDNISAESEMLATTFVVPSDSLILLISYATVIENGLHPDNKQSRFSFNITSSGILPQGCNSIEVLAGDTSSSVITIGSIEIQPWQTRAINLFGLTGDSMTIQFATADCAPGGHFGYAYIDCEIVPANLVTHGCDASGNLMVSINPRLNVRWHDNTIADTIIITNPTVNANYFAEINYNTSCNFQIPIDIESAIQVPTFSYSVDCNKQVFFDNTSNAPVGTTYLWTFGDGLHSNSINPVHQYQTDSIFQVIINAQLPNNCKSSSYSNILISSPTFPIINYSDNCINSNISFHSYSDPNSPQIVSYEWFIDNVNISNNALFNFNFNETGTYNISLNFIYSNGCSGTTSKSISIIDNFDCITDDDLIFIPNAFSPNNDGINDTYKVFFTSNNTTPLIQIFNRYGELIYEGNEWNGQFNGKDCMSGIYYFKCTMMAAGKPYIKTGTLTLVR